MLLDLQLQDITGGFAGGRELDASRRGGNPESRVRWSMSQFVSITKRGLSRDGEASWLSDFEPGSMKSKACCPLVPHPESVLRTATAVFAELNPSPHLCYTAGLCGVVPD